MSFQDIANPLIALGVPVVRLRPRSKIPFENNWPDLATTDPRVVLQWSQTTPDANCASVAKSDGIVFFESDEPGIIKRYCEETGQAWTNTFTVQSRPGRFHFYFWQTDLTRQVSSITQTELKFGSVRQHNQYVVSPGSIHPETGQPYKVVRDVEIIPAPDSLWRWLVSKKQKAEQACEDRTDRGLIPHGQMYGHLIKQAGILWGQGHPPELIPDMLVAWAHHNCEEPIDEEKVRQYAKGAGWKSGDGLETHVTLGGKVVGIAEEPKDPVVSFAPENPKESWQKHGMTKERYQEEMEKEFPVLPLPPAGGPTWDDSLMYGIAGDVVRKAAMFCEAHPSGMYLDLLVAVGNLIGRSPYCKRNADRHGTNEFVIRVGDTSISRKGTGRNIINEFISKLDQDWYKNRVKDGFKSPEAVIAEIKDDNVNKVRKNEKGGTHTWIQEVEPGVMDKRLFIRASELASLFKLATDGSQTDVVLRNAWDSVALRAIVKSKTDEGMSKSVACQEPHVSVSGDITKDELLAIMPTGAYENGFGNRFLYCYVARTKVCPGGSPDIDWSPEVAQFAEMLSFAKSVGRVAFSPSATKMWNYMYVELGNLPSNIVGRMSSRSQPHVCRLALILALLDGYDELQSTHLKAAKAIWDYCADSVQYIFGDYSKDQKRILDFVERRTTSTVSDIRVDCFHGHKSAEWVKSQVEDLIQRTHPYLIYVDKARTTVKKP